MVKYPILGIIFLFCFSLLNAQSKYIITGQIVDADNNEPMLYANIALSRDTDSTLVAGTVTNADGNFKFENIAGGKYFIKASFIGYEKKETPVFELIGNIYVGKLVLKKLSILIDEVTVSGEKSTLVSGLEKKIYNVGKDIISESGSVSDILQNIPSVSVDVNGNVTIRGTTKITYLINGRSSARLRRNPATALKTIPAYTIERIEVITNPSAKYNPEGTGGIVNIIARKDTETGKNGQIIGNIGNESKYNTGINLSYGQSNLNTFLSYSLRHPSGTNIFFDERIKKDISNGQVLTKYNENGKSLTKPLAHVLDAGLVYQFNDDNLIEFSGNYFSQNSFHKGSSLINLINGQNQLIESYRSENTNDEYEKEGEGGISFEHLFNGNEDHSLVLEAAVAGYDEKEDLIFNEISSFPNNELAVKNLFVNKRGSQIELVSEYAMPINDESDFEAGYTGEFIHDNIFYINESGPNRFLFDQNIHALYGLYSRDINNFNLELGLRGEFVGIKSHLTVPNDVLIPNDYFKLYPSVGITYEIDKYHNLRFSYGKRVNRPEADQLNPFPEFIDPRNAEAGNPYLKPEQIHSFEFSYQNISESITITPGIFYRHKYDAFTSVSNSIGDSVIILTTENLAKQQSAGIETLVSGNLFKWWDYNLSASLFYNEIDASNLGYSNRKSNISGTVELYSLFKISKKTLFQLNFSYNSPVLTPQGQKEEIFFLNAGIKRLLYYDQISLTISVTDLFGSYKENLKINIPELNQVTSLYRKQPIIYLGFSWRFGDSYQGDEKKLEFEGEGLRKY
ncbi:MAG TPA: TonB-dependent receptor [Ignavibacteriaceae bacterium]|nr:TonB-dependent receptor [Ignavibacteriaceae bacterium]